MDMAWNFSDSPNSQTEVLVQALGFPLNHTPKPQIDFYNTKVIFFLIPLEELLCGK